MAVTGTVVESAFRKKLKCEVAVEITTNGSGAGTAVDVNLTEAFTNAPQMMVVKPLGSTGTYSVLTVYDGATPKITVDCTGELASSVVEVILVAWDTN